MNALRYPVIKPVVGYDFVIDIPSEIIFSLRLETYKAPDNQYTSHRAKIAFRNYRDNQVINPDISVLEQLADIIRDIDQIKASNKDRKKWVRTIGDLRVDISHKRVTVTHHNVKMFLLDISNQFIIYGFLNAIASIKKTVDFWCYHGQIIEPDNYIKRVIKPNVYYEGIQNIHQKDSLASSFTALSLTMWSTDYNDTREHNFSLRFGHTRLAIKDTIPKPFPYDRVSSALIQEFLINVQNDLNSLAHVIIDDENLTKNHYKHFKVDNDLLVGTSYFKAATELREANTYVGLLKNTDGKGYTTVINCDLINPFSKISINSRLAKLDDVTSLLGHALAHLTK